MEERHAALETFPNSYSYVNTFSGKNMKVAYLAIEYHQTPLNPLSNIIPRMHMTVRDFKNKFKSVKKDGRAKIAQLKGFQLGNPVTIQSELWTAFKGEFFKRNFKRIFINV